MLSNRTDLKSLEILDIALKYKANNKDKDQIVSVQVFLDQNELPYSQVMP